MSLGLRLSLANVCPDTALDMSDTVIDMPGTVLDMSDTVNAVYGCVRTRFMTVINGY